jgi:phospholipid transport system substrate-binding protein
VTARSFTRAAIVAGMISLGALASAPAAYAVRNTEAENYVQANATRALAALGDNSVSETQRQQTFNTLIQRFADMPRIAGFVLGRYGAQLRNDAALRNQWIEAFEDYSIAVYDLRLGAFNGSTVRVIGSIERSADDVIVQSEMVPANGGRAQPVEWRLIRRNGVWKVNDVSVILDGNQIWLAQQQQGEFLARLDRNNGNVADLVADLRQRTASIRDRVASRNA